MQTDVLSTVSRLGFASALILSGWVHAGSVNVACNNGIFEVTSELETGETCFAFINTRIAGELATEAFGLLEEGNFPLVVPAEESGDFIFAVLNCDGGDEADPNLTSATTDATDACFEIEAEAPEEEEPVEDEPVEDEPEEDAEAEEDDASTPAQTDALPDNLADAEERLEEARGSILIARNVRDELCEADPGSDACYAAIELQRLAQAAFRSARDNVLDLREAEADEDDADEDDADEDSEE